MNHNQRFYLVTYQANDERHQKLIVAESDDDAKAQFHRSRRKFYESKDMPEMIAAVIVSAVPVTQVLTLKPEKPKAKRL